MSVQINEVTIQDGPLPTGPLVAYSYDPVTSCVFLMRLEPNMVIPLNTSWGYVKDSVLPMGLVLHTLAPFPPPFFDAAWYNPLDYVDTTAYVFDGTAYNGDAYADSEAASTTPDLSKVVKLLDDVHAWPVPSVYSMGLVTQEADGRKLLWRVRHTTHTHVHGATNVTVSSNYWESIESAYLYKAGGMYFGGRDYAGPLNSVLFDGQNGSAGTVARILDLNEFPVNDDNETYVHAYCCNYNRADSKVYCVLNKATGRMAEIGAAAQLVKYFTLTVPNDSEICQLFYTTRLMYTVRNTVTGAYSLYDAHNNGLLLYTFDLGTFDPASSPQFSIIN